MKKIIVGIAIILILVGVWYFYPLEGEHLLYIEKSVDITESEEALSVVSGEKYGTLYCIGEISNNDDGSCEYIKITWKVDIEIMPDKEVGGYIYIPFLDIRPDIEDNPWEGGLGALVPDSTGLYDIWNDAPVGESCVWEVEMVFHKDDMRVKSILDGVTYQDFMLSDVMEDAKPEWKENMVIGYQSIGNGEMDVYGDFWYHIDVIPSTERLFATEAFGIVKDGNSFYFLE